MSSDEVVAPQTLNDSAQDHRSSVIKVFGYQNINVLMKNDYDVHNSSILKVSMKLKEAQNHPERLARTSSPRVGLHGSRKALEQLAVSPSFDVDSFSLKSPPRLAHAHTVNSEILSASLDVSSVNLLQNNPRNPIIAKRNPNIERMIQDNSKFNSPRQSPSGDKLKSTFSSFGLYRSSSVNSSFGSFTVKDATNIGLPQNWSNNTSAEDLTTTSSHNLRVPSLTLSSSSSGSSSNNTVSTMGSNSYSSSSGVTSTDTHDYSAGLLTTMEEVLTMLNETSTCSPRTKSTVGASSSTSTGSPGDGSRSGNSSSESSPKHGAGTGGARIGSEPTPEEVRQHQMQVYSSMREFVGHEYRGVA